MLGRLVRLASPLGQQVGKFLAEMIRDVDDYQAEDRKNLLNKKILFKMLIDFQQRW